jgi:hypothetical protein
MNSNVLIEFTQVGKVVTWILSNYSMINYNRSSYADASLDEENEGNGLKSDDDDQERRNKLNLAMKKIRFIIFHLQMKTEQFLEAFDTICEGIN